MTITAPRAAWRDCDFPDQAGGWKILAEGSSYQGCAPMESTLKTKKMQSEGKMFEKLNAEPTPVLQFHSCLIYPE